MHISDRISTAISELRSFSMKEFLMVSKRNSVPVKTLVLISGVRLKETQKKKVKNVILKNKSNRREKINLLLLNVLDLVKLGCSVKESCQKLGANDSFLYRNITSDQRKKLADARRLRKMNKSQN